MARSNYFANAETKIYHDAKATGDACRESEIKASNRVHFDKAENAESSGYRACKVCIGKFVTEPV